MIKKFTKEEIESVWEEPLAGNIQSIYGKINELVDAVNELQAKCAILQEHAHPTATTDRIIGCTTLDIPESYKNDQLTLATLDYSKKLEKENSDLKDEVEKLQDAIDYLEGSLWYIFNNAPDLEKARQEANISLKRIQELDND